MTAVETIKVQLLQIRVISYHSKKNNGNLNDEKHTDDVEEDSKLVVTWQNDE